VPGVHAGVVNVDLQCGWLSKSSQVKSSHSKSVLCDIEKLESEHSCRTFFFVRGSWQHSRMSGQRLAADIDSDDDFKSTPSRRQIRPK
jgi:hypothetical protein